MNETGRHVNALEATSRCVLEDAFSGTSMAGLGSGARGVPRIRNPAFSAVRRTLGSPLRECRVGSALRLSAEKGVAWRGAVWLCARTSGQVFDPATTIGSGRARLARESRRSVPRGRTVDRSRRRVLASPRRGPWILPPRRDGFLSDDRPIFRCVRRRPDRPVERARMGRRSEKAGALGWIHVDGLLDRKSVV